MASQVFFKLQHGKVAEPISFAGPHIKLIDLKRAILEKKDMKTGFDFDLKIIDADNSSKTYEGDDTLVPRNTSVVVKRMPVAVGSGILSRLQARRPTVATGTHEIILPTKAEANIDEVTEEVKVEPVVVSAAVVEPPAPLMEIADDEDELALLRSITESTNSKSSNLSWSRDTTSTSFASGVGHHAAPTTGMTHDMNRSGSIIPIVPSANLEIEKQKSKLQAKHYRTAPRAGSGYVCRRCQGTDHYLENCPTNGDPAYDKQKLAPGVNVPLTLYNTTQTPDIMAAETKQLHGVPLSSRNRVTDLTGIDTTGKLVIFHKESKSYEILEPFNDGYKKLIKEGGLSSAEAKTAIANAPAHLKCPITNTILCDAVQLPCCFRIVSDGPIRQKLMENNFKCPLCNKPNVSIDDIQPHDDVRQRVNEFLQSISASAKATNKNSDSDAVVIEGGVGGMVRPPPPPLLPNLMHAGGVGPGAPPPPPPTAPPPSSAGMGFSQQLLFQPPPSTTFPLSMNGMPGMMFPGATGTGGMNGMGLNMNNPLMMMNNMNGMMTGGANGMMLPFNAPGVAGGMMPGMNAMNLALLGNLPEVPPPGFFPQPMTFQEFRKERYHQQSMRKEEGTSFIGGPSYNAEFQRANKLNHHHGGHNNNASGGDGSYYGHGAANGNTNVGSSIGFGVGGVNVNPHINIPDGPVRVGKVPCRFYPNCAKGDKCTYMHPTDARDGRGGMPVVSISGPSYGGSDSHSGSGGYGGSGGGRKDDYYAQGRSNDNKHSGSSSGQVDDKESREKNYGSSGYNHSNTRKRSHSPDYKSKDTGRDYYGRDKDRERDSASGGSGREAAGKDKDSRDSARERSDRDRDTRDSRDQRDSGKGRERDYDREGNSSNKSRRLEDDRIPSSQYGRGGSDRDRDYRDDKARGDRDREIKEKDTRDRSDRERGDRDREIREKDTRDRSDRDREIREKDTRDRSDRDREIREKDTRDRSDRERSDRDREIREKDTRDRSDRERSDRDREIREKDTRDRGDRERSDRDRERNAPSAGSKPTPATGAASTVSVPSKEQKWDDSRDRDRKREREGDSVRSDRDRDNGDKFSKDRSDRGSNKDNDKGKEKLSITVAAEGSRTVSLSEDGGYVTNKHKDAMNQPTKGGNYQSKGKRGDGGGRWKME